MLPDDPRLKEVGKATRFTKTNQPKIKRGRKPSQFKKYLKDNNMGNFDAALIAKSLLDKTRAEIAEIANDKDQPILLCGAAAALLKDMAKGRVDVLRWLTERGYGMPVQPTESLNVNLNIEATPLERRKLLDEYFRKNYQDQLPGGGNSTPGQPESSTGRPKEIDKAELGETEKENN